MINSFGTGKPTEADGSGRGTGKRTEAAAAVRLFGLFGCSGCSAVRAVRLFGLFGRRRLSSPAWPAASGSEAPTAAGDSSSNSRFQQLIFLRLSPIGGSGWKPSADDGKIHRCAGGCAGGGSPPPNGQRRAERSPHRSRSSSSNRRFQQLTGDIRNGTEYFKHQLRHHRIAVSLYGLRSPSGIRNGETVHIKGKPIMSATYSGDSWKISPSFLGIFSLTRRANVGRSFAFFPRERFTRPVPLSVAVGVGSSVNGIGHDCPFLLIFRPCVCAVGNNPDSVSAVWRTDGTSRNNERLDFISNTFKRTDDVVEDIVLIFSE